MEESTFWDGVTFRAAAVGNAPELVPVRMTVGIGSAMDCEWTMASEYFLIPSFHKMAENRVSIDFRMASFHWKETWLLQIKVQ